MFLLNASSAGNILSILQIAALIAAFLFFLLKVVSGYLLIDMSVEVTPKRVKCDDKEDYLVIGLKLEKHQNCSVNIHDIAANITDSDGKKITTEKFKFEKVGCDSIRRFFGLGKIEWEKENKSGYITLAPREVTHLVCNIKEKIKSDEIYKVEVAVLGKGWFRPAISRWYCSVASLPNSEDQSQLKQLKNDIGSLKKEIVNLKVEQQTELKNDICSLKTELQNDIGSLKTEFKNDIGSLKTEIVGLKTKQTNAKEPTPKSNN
ncbi:hypothetical protein [Candidatus Uabimicrobium amorphum]|uniref:Uncharacterized protein n=1 Tax=Uabimicrobium amorphum TaxID=2596890 RepID=A0A5S9IR59_UABAM|nr:hypothetical protein [Candidatus Uabimicrobium amorphum]BBM86598.1 hypothetical protein UABAM_04984 [Candidatus Uabimicrobium amorphum]